MLLQERIEGPEFHGTRCSTLRGPLLECACVLLSGYNNPARLRKAGKELMADPSLVAEAAKAGSRQTTFSDTLRSPTLHKTSTSQNISSASVQLQGLLNYYLRSFPGISARFVGLELKTPTHTWKQNGKFLQPDAAATPKQADPGTSPVDITIPTIAMAQANESVIKPEELDSTV